MSTRNGETTLNTIFTMGIFNLFGRDKPKPDLYWEFDTHTHYRPKLNKGDFFKLTGSNLAGLYLNHFEIC
jgi:hypothetical protein